MRVKLTDKNVQNAKPPRIGRLELADALEPGFALRITEDDRRSWTVRLWVGPVEKRVQRRVTLGHPRERDGFPVLSLAQAREAARHVKQAAAEGKPLNPAGRPNGLSFAELVEEYLAAKQGILRPRSIGEIGRVLRYRDFDSWSDRPAASITSDDVRRLRDDIHERGAVVQATRTLRILSALGSWAVSEGKLTINPAKGILRRTAETPRDRILGDDEVTAFWQASGELGFPFRDLFRLLLLTGQRLSEVAGMEWREITFERREWTIPALRCKNGRQHIIHLSEPVTAILVALAEQRQKIEMLRTSRFVFTTRGDIPVAGPSRTKTKFDAAIAKALGRDLPPFVTHDLRRTCASGMARLGINLPVIERCLNHVGASFAGVAGIYQRHSFREEMAAAFEAWGRFVVSLVEPTRNVVQLHIVRERALPLDVGVANEA